VRFKKKELRPLGKRTPDHIYKSLFSGGEDLEWGGGGIGQFLSANVTGWQGVGGKKRKCGGVSATGKRGDFLIVSRKEKGIQKER